MRRYELNDREWELIAERVPQGERRRGRPWRDHRQVINGMLWILRSGAPSRDLPERYGPWQTSMSASTGGGTMGRWRRSSRGCR